MGRPGLSAGQKAELWQRWKSGQSLSEIGRTLGKHAGSVHTVLAAHGGIVPATRKRSPRSLSLKGREEISRGLAAGESLRQIAATLKRSPSTISREVGRHSGKSTYRAIEADANAWSRAQRPKPCRLTTQPLLQAVVADKLRQDWSPEQIAGWLKQTYPINTPMQISHETIYKSLFIQARGVLKKELMQHLRSRRMMRRGKSSSTAGQPRGQIVDAVSIKDRPAESDLWR
jgi:IS30 family transposase